MRLGRRLDTGIAEDPVPAPEPDTATDITPVPDEVDEPHRAPVVAEV